MEAVAVTKYIRMAPRKARIVARALAGKPASEAVRITELSEKKASFLIGKTLKSAIANAKENEGITEDKMWVKEAVVEVGPTLKRHRFCARGRVHPIMKRMCHIKIVLTDEKIRKG